MVTSFHIWIIVKKNGNNPSSLTYLIFFLFHPIAILIFLTSISPWYSSNLKEINDYIFLCCKLECLCSTLRPSVIWPQLYFPIKSLFKQASSFTDPCRYYAYLTFVALCSMFPSTGKFLLLDPIKIYPFFIAQVPTAPENITWLS